MYIFANKRLNMSANTNPEIDKLNTKIKELKILLKRKDLIIKEKDEDIKTLLSACEKVKTETIKLVDAYNKNKEYLRQAHETLRNVFQQNISIN